MYVASMTDGTTGRQDGYLISSVSENSNFLSAYRYTLDIITPRIPQLRQRRPLNLVCNPRTSATYVRNTSQPCTAFTLRTLSWLMYSRSPSTIFNNLCLLEVLSITSYLLSFAWDNY